MVVWGGHDVYGTYFNTGGRYNPATNSWTPTSTADAPSARRGHTAVWMGSEMAVWGGEDRNGWLNGGGAPGPESDIHPAHHDLAWQSIR